MTPTYADDPERSLFKLIFKVLGLVFVVIVAAMSLVYSILWFA